MFLVWLLFSSIIGTVILAKIYSDFEFLLLALAILVTYVVLGIIFYRVNKYFGIVEEPRLEDVIPLKEMAKVKPPSGVFRN